MTKTIRFDELPTQSVPIDEIVRKYSDITTAFDHASDTGRRVEVLREWDDFERKLETRSRFDDYIDGDEHRLQGVRIFTLFGYMGKLTHPPGSTPRLLYPRHI